MAKSRTNAPGTSRDTDVEVGADLRAEEAKSRAIDTPGKIIRRRFLKHRMAVISLIFFVLLVVTVFVWAFLLPADAATQVDIYNANSGPSRAHPMGTDQVGSDVLKRIILGGRVSLTVGLLAVTIAVTLGTIIGAVAGYYGGLIDNLLMRIADMMLSIPLLLLIVMLAAILGPSVRTIIIVIGLTSWMGISRIVRANFLSLKNKEFVEAARSIGVKDYKLIFRHILPNSTAPIIVAATLGLAEAVLLEAYVSFLGYGIQPPEPSWGNMVTSGGFLVTIQQAPWMMFFPGIMITLTVLTVNFIGDGLRDALDPFSRL